MASQAQIESAAGIDKEVAKYMMAGGSQAAKLAMSTLKLCVSRFEPGAFGLLKAAVADCKREMAGS